MANPLEMESTKPSTSESISGGKSIENTLLEIPKTLLWDPWFKDIPESILGIGKQLLNSFWPF